MNTTILGNAGVVSKKMFAGSEGKKSFMILRVVLTERDVKTFINVHVYDKLAELVDKYVVPGSKVNINGKLKTNPRTTKSGDKIDELVVVANSVEFLSSPKKKDADGTDGGNPTPTSPTPAANNDAEDEAPAAVTAATEEDEEEDDLPF